MQMNIKIYIFEENQGCRNETKQVIKNWYGAKQIYQNIYGQERDVIRRKCTKSLPLFYESCSLKTVESAINVCRYSEEDTETGNTDENQQAGKVGW